MSRFLIHDGFILTLSATAPNLQQGDILIENERISAIGPNLKSPTASRIEASGCVVMPGLVNAHLHCWQTPLRGMALNWTLESYLTKILGELAPRFTPEDIYWSTLAAAQDQIDAGTTTVIDWSHNAPTPAHAEAALAALGDAGIRALFLRGKFNPPHGKKMDNDEWADIRVPAAASALLTTGMSILGPAFSPLDTVREELKRAQRHDEVISMHWAGPLVSDAFRRLADEGLITSKVNIVHGNGMADDELQTLITSEATFTVTPEIEMQMGFAPGITGRLLAGGTRPSLGVDSETASSPEMFQVARFAMQLQRYLDHQNAWNHSGKPMDTVSITSLDVLQWATIDGARAAGLAGRVGVLEPGKLADIILVRVPEISSGAILDPVNLIASTATTTDVDTVIVNGRLLKQSGKRIGYSDSEISDKLSEISRRVLSLGANQPFS
jgi:cytosine/adenosine deaminase-related metal-dependent hydrolase